MKFYCGNVSRGRQASTNQKNKFVVLTSIRFDEIATGIRPDFILLKIEVMFILYIKTGGCFHPLN